jgi:hypothetical protein
MNGVPAPPEHTEDHGTDLDQTQIEVDLVRNTIAVSVPGSVHDAVRSAGVSATGTLDIGMQGRLMGLEVGDYYVDISNAVESTGHLNRSVVVLLFPCKCEDGQDAVGFRRAGADYEISFPSGNQCWEVGRTDSGEPVRICSVLAG